jgi:uncharacterized protein (DUF952 family)
MPNMADHGPPLYIYKIVPSSAPPPEPLPKALPISELDKSSGYMHMSTAGQVLGTLKRFFAQDDLVYILRVPHERVAKYIKWEDPEGIEGDGPGEGRFPHIYNDFKLGQDEIESVRTWKRDGDWAKGSGGNFTDILSA